MQARTLPFRPFGAIPEFLSISVSEPVFLPFCVGSALELSFSPR